MRNKLPFLLTLAVLAFIVLFSGTQINAQWQREDQRDNKQKPNQIKRDNREERIIVKPGVRPNVHVVRPARPLKPTVQVVRPGTQIYKAESYSRNDRFNDRYYEGNSYGSFAQVARINGYEDGLKEGSKDARDGDSFDPFAESDYKDGANGFRSIYGDRETYKQLYRQSFLRGYREAFNRYLGSAGQINW